MLKTILKEGAWYAVSDLLSKGLSFFLLPIYTRLLTPTDYGIIDMMTVTGTLVTYVVGLEISQSLVRFVPSMTNEREKASHLSTAFWFYVFSFFVLFVIATLGRFQLSRIVFDDTVDVRVFETGMISVILNAIYFFGQNMLRMNRKVKTSVAINFVYIIVTIGLAIYFIVVRKLGVTGNFYATICGSTAGIVLFLLRGSYVTFQFDTRTLRKLLRFSIPLIPASIATYFTFYIDRIFIKEFLSIGDLGIYGIALRFASLTNLLISGVLTALGPIVFQHFEKEETPRQLAQVFDLFIIGATLFIVCTALFAKEAVMLFTTPVYYSAFQYIAILCFNIIVYNLYIFMPGLSIAKKTQYIAILALVSGVINLVLNYILIHRYGIWGSIVATTVASLLSQLATLYFSHKYYRMPIRFKQFFALLFVNLLLVLFYPAVETWKGMTLDWGWIGLKAAIVSAALSFLVYRISRTKLRATGETSV